MPVPADILDAIDALDEQKDKTDAQRTEMGRLAEQLLGLQDQVKAAEDKYREEYTKQNELTAKLQARITDEYLVQVTLGADRRPTGTSTRGK